MNIKKYFLTLIFVLLLSSNLVFAQQTTSTSTTENPTTTTPTKIMGFDIAKGRIGEFLQLLENTRIHYAEYFLKIRDDNKKAFSTIEIKDLDQKSQTTDVAGVESDNVKMPSTTQLKDHFLEYVLYFLASSLYSFFSSKAIFYVGLILIAFLSLRFILRKFL